MIDDLYPLIIDVFQVALQTHFHTSSSKNLPFVHPSLVGGLEHELYDFPYIGNNTS